MTAPLTLINSGRPARGEQPAITVTIDGQTAYAAVESAIKRLRLYDPRGETS